MKLTSLLLLSLLNSVLSLGLHYDETKASLQVPIALGEHGEVEQLMFSVEQLLQSPESYSHITGPLNLRSRRLVQLFNETANSPRWITEGDKYWLRLQGVKFMDVTDHSRLGSLNQLRQEFVPSRKIDYKTSLPTHPFNVDYIQRTFDSLNTTDLKLDIAKLSSFWNRNYRSPWGLASSNWIYESAENIFFSRPRPSSVVTSVQKFKHSFLQNSIIARLQSSSSLSSSTPKRTIILSAHQDSLNYRYPFYRAPGADDDGSGSVTILQVLRSLVNEEFIPPDDIIVEWHWYAAEEGGLLGSQDIAAEYEKEGVDVKGEFQMDMTAYVKPDTTPIIGFFDEQVSSNLTSFATSLVETYLTPSSGIQWNFTRCGAGCGSDHMSWNKAGYEAIFASESLFEDASLEFIHTTKDSLADYGEAYSYEHMLEFVKLGIAWIVELSTA